MLNMLPDKIQSLRVLIVDDDQSMRKLLRTMLAAIGVNVSNVVEASDALDGLEAIRLHLPDLIIVDWQMPVIDGSQFVRMVRTSGDCPIPGVPIIMLTGHGEGWRVKEAARIGVHEYLLKPVSIKALQDRIATIIRHPRPTVVLDGYYGPMPRRLTPV
jgi:two-component system chemotaxis response regulator CheY